MKVAVVYDCLAYIGGAERELLTLVNVLKADLITTEYHQDKTYKEFKDINVIDNPIKNFNIPLIRDARMIDKFKEVNLSDYDLIFSLGNWSKGIVFNKTLHARHIHITISPPRILYDLRKSVRDRISLFKKPIFDIWTAETKEWDQNAMKKVKEIVLQSRTGIKRMVRYYGNDIEEKIHPIILYPPTDIHKFKNKASKDYFLSVQRIEVEKGIEHQITAFNKMPEKKLVIAGGCVNEKYLKKLKDISKRNIEFRTNVTDAELIKLYSECIATIQTSLREDFGLVPIESMASGKPCIAVKDGGFKETIIKDTGILINKPYPINLIKAVRNFDADDFDKKDMKKRCRIFSVESFKKRLECVVKTNV